MSLHDRLPELIGLVYDAALDTARWQDAMRLLTDLLGGPAVLLSEDRSNVSAQILSGTFDPGFLRSYAAHYVTTNIWKQHSIRYPLGSLVTGDMAPRDDFERSEWLHDWLRPQGLYHGIGVHLQQSGTQRTSLSVMRSRSRGTWTAEELALWRALMPHVQRAIEAHRRIAAAAVRRDAGLAGLEALGAAVLLVDGSGRLLWLNARAEALLAAGDGLAARLGGLAATNALAADRLARLIAEAAATAAGRGSGPGGALRAPRRGGPPLDLLVCPLAPSAAAFGLLAPAALIFVHDPASRPATSEVALRALWGLSPAEARLLLGLLRGLDLDAYAAEAAIAPSTARTLLRRLMRKLGESRQSGVLRAVLANPIARLAAGLDGR